MPLGTCPAAGSRPCSPSSPPPVSIRLFLGPCHSEQCAASTPSCLLYSWSDFLWSAPQTGVPKRQMTRLQHSCGPARSPSGPRAAFLQPRGSATSATTKPDPALPLAAGRAPGLGCCCPCPAPRAYGLLGHVDEGGSPFWTETRRCHWQSWGSNELGAGGSPARAVLVRLGEGQGRRSHDPEKEPASAGQLSCVCPRGRRGLAQGKPEAARKTV